MDTFNIIAGCASIISLLISIFALSEVNKVKQKIKIEGNDNFVSGRDINVKK